MAKKPAGSGQSTPARTGASTPSTSSAGIPQSTSKPTVNATPSKASQQSRVTSSQSSSSSSPQEILQQLWNSYVDKTPQRTKLIDVFMAFLIFVGVVQFVYCVLLGNYVSDPFIPSYPSIQCISVPFFLSMLGPRVTSIPWLD